MVYYKGVELTSQRLDLVVDDKVVVEIKSTEKLGLAAPRQLFSYLHATRFEVGLLLHFGPEPRFFRTVASNRYKEFHPRSSAIVRDIRRIREAKAEKPTLEAGGAVYISNDSDLTMPDTISRRTALATLAALAAGCRVSVSRSSDATSAQPAGATDLATIMELAGVPGIAVAQVSGSSVQARGVGMTRASGGRSVDADTVFEAASLSKPVFAYLVTQLVAERALDLDRPLREYVPLPASDARSSGITARHVLSHSTGWRNWRNTTTQPLVADFDPGSRFGYSGEGFYYLQRVVEKVTGSGILRLTRDRVFRPFGMERTSYMWAPWMDANRAEPHSNRAVPAAGYLAPTSKGMLDAAAAANVAMDSWTHESAERFLPTANRDVPVLPNFLLPNVAGSMATTANDYGRFLVRLMSDEAALRVMMAPTTPINRVIQWGVGVGLQTQSGSTSFWHWGDTFGFKNFFVADPVKRAATVVFTNGQNGRAVYERVVRDSRGDQPAFLWI